MDLYNFHPKQPGKSRLGTVFKDTFVPLHLFPVLGLPHPKTSSNVILRKRVTKQFLVQAWGQKLKNILAIYLQFEQLARDCDWVDFI
jgi:hypothetical protein